MKKQRFPLLCLIVVLAMILGAAYRATALGELRTELLYQYKMEYTVLVRSVPDTQAAMYDQGMGLYLDAQTPAGSVTEVTAVSNGDGTSDITLTVAASGSRLTESGYGDYAITQDNAVEFLSRFLTFTGYITEVKEV